MSRSGVTASQNHLREINTTHLGIDDDEFGLHFANPAHHIADDVTLLDATQERISCRQMCYNRLVYPESVGMKQPLDTTTNGTIARSLLLLLFPHQLCSVDDGDGTLLSLANDKRREQCATCGSAGE